MVNDTPIMTNKGWGVEVAFRQAGRRDSIAASESTVFLMPAGGNCASAAKAEIAVRSGKSQLFLSDENQSATRMGISMILATAGVHTTSFAKACGPSPDQRAGA
jgi:glutamate synthase (NADPH/NADH) large chain